MAALEPPTLTGQPPTLQNTGQRANVLLGKLMNFDENMSPFQNRACGFCHMPYAGFSGPIPSVNLTMIAYPGSFQFRAGKRTAQRYTYCPNFPVLNYEHDRSSGLFWRKLLGFARDRIFARESRRRAGAASSGRYTRNVSRHGMYRFPASTAEYRPLFEQVWGVGSLDIKFPARHRGDLRNPGGAKKFGTDTTPIELSPEDRAKANNVYDHWGESLAQYEASPDVSAYSSKFDAFLEGTTQCLQTRWPVTTCSDGKGNCNSCHLDGRGTTTLTQGQTDTSATALVRPLFTCFGSSNLGLPLNPRDAFYYQTTPDFFGFTGNPYGFGYRDLGLGTFLRSGFGAAPNPN